MKIKYIICIILITITYSCREEDPLVPTEVKDWYTIYPTENMDPIDSKIYELYRKYNIAVFYKDTLGYEDRGWKDEKGNPKYYYEVLKLQYHITEGEGDNLYWKMCDVSTPEKKMELMPMLEYLDDKLLKCISGADVFIPTLIILDTVAIIPNSTIPENKNLVNCKRGFNFIGLSNIGVNDANFDSNKYSLDFIIEASYKNILKNLDAFYDYVLGFFYPLHTIDLFFRENPWGVTYAIYGKEFEDFVDIQITHESNVENCKMLMEMVNGIRKELEETGYTEEEIQNDIMYQIYYEIYLEFYELWEEYLPVFEEAKTIFYQYGFLGPGTFYPGGIPTKEEDAQMYMELIFTKTEKEIQDIYGQYFGVMARYEMMKSLLVELNFNLDEIRTIFK